MFNIRITIERRILNVADIVALDTEGFKSSLGPGYRPGWWSWSNLGGRKDWCNPDYECRRTKLWRRRCKSWRWGQEHLEEHYNEVIEKMESTDDYNEFGRKVDDMYHGLGHMRIAYLCSTKWKKKGIMATSEVSARDPVFYRWHQHIEDIVQEFRDKKLGKYELTDFALSDNIKVAGLETIVQTEDAADIIESNLENVLITFEETTDVRHHRQSRLRYERFNHIPFNYKIKVENPNQVTKKVIVRIFMAIALDNEDKRYDS